MHIVFVVLFWWSPFIPSRNLDEVFLTYNQMAILFLRSRSHVKASIILTRADHYCIHNYKIIPKIIVIPILIVLMGL